jgi:energy-converting hydrogenase Eha subunit C
MVSIMNKPTCLFSLALIAASFVFAADAQAEQIYEFAFEQSSYTVVEGSTVDITFLLRETVTNGDTARFAVGDNDGFFAFGVNADFSSFTGGAGSTVAATSDVAINAIFDDSTANDVALVGSTVDINGNSSNGNGIEIAETSPDVYELTLATLTVTAGELGSVTTFSLDDHTNTGGIFSLFADAFVIDSVATYGSTEVTVVSAIPEPASTLILVGVAGLGLVRRRRR